MPEWSPIYSCDLRPLQDKPERAIYELCVCNPDGGPIALVAYTYKKKQDWALHAIFEPIRYAALAEFLEKPFPPGVEINQQRDIRVYGKYPIWWGPRTWRQIKQRGEGPFIGDDLPADRQPEKLFNPYGLKTLERPDFYAGPYLSDYAAATLNRTPKHVPLFYSSNRCPLVMPWEAAEPYQKPLREVFRRVLIDAKRWSQKGLGYETLLTRPDGQSCVMGYSGRRTLERLIYPLIKFEPHAQAFLGETEPLQLAEKSSDQHGATITLRGGHRAYFTGRILEQALKNPSPYPLISDFL